MGGAAGRGVRPLGQPETRGGGGSPRAVGSRPHGLVCVRPSGQTVEPSGLRPPHGGVQYIDHTLLVRLGCGWGGTLLVTE